MFILKDYVFRYEKSWFERLTDPKDLNLEYGLNLAFRESNPFMCVNQLEARKVGFVLPGK